MELKNLCYSSSRFINKKQYIDRLEYELSIIEEKGFEQYFLFVYNAIKLAKENGILTGGRGSAAGSLVNYYLHITELDPIKYNLLFERFLNINRTDAADIDVDLSDKREFAKVLSNHYGDKFDVVPICSKLTLGLKDLLAKVFKVFNIQYPHPKYVDSSQFFSGIITSEEISNINELFKHDEFNNLLNWVKKNRKGLRLKRYMLLLNGNISTNGVHAGGMLVLKSNSKNVPYIPINHPDFEYVSGFSESDSTKELELVGEIKFDFLGSITLKVIADTLNKINISIDEININDADVFRFISKYLHTKGLFQLESSGMTNILKEFKPKNIEELSAVIATYRPGALNANIDKHMIDAKRDKSVGRKRWHPSVLSLINDIVEETYYQPIYQEQVMQIGSVIGKFASKDLNDFRKFISSKAMKTANPEKYKKLNDKFYTAFMENGVKQGVPKNELRALWEDLKGASLYNFNKSHSMVYAYRAYITAWLMYYHPLQYFYSILKNRGLSDFIYIINEYSKERDLGIKLVTPKLGSASTEMVCDFKNNRIVLNVNSLKGVGEKASQELIKTNSWKIEKESDIIGKIEEKKYGRGLTKGTFKVLTISGFFDDVIGFDGRNKMLEFLGYDKLNQIEMLKKENDIVGIPLNKDRGDSIVVELTKDICNICPKLKESNKDFIIIDSVNKRKTKNGNRFYSCKGLTLNGEEISFNVFSQKINILRNVYEKNLTEGEYILFWELDGGFNNVLLLVPIK